MFGDLLNNVWFFDTDICLYLMYIPSECNYQVQTVSCLVLYHRLNQYMFDLLGIHVWAIITLMSGILVHV